MLVYKRFFSGNTKIKDKNGKVLQKEDDQAKGWNLTTNTFCFVSNI